MNGGLYACQGCGRATEIGMPATDLIRQGCEGKPELFISYDDVIQALKQMEPSFHNNTAGDEAAELIESIFGAAP